MRLLFKIITVRRTTQAAAANQLGSLVEQKSSFPLRFLLKSQDTTTGRVLSSMYHSLHKVHDRRASTITSHVHLPKAQNAQFE